MVYVSVAGFVPDARIDLSARFVSFAFPADCIVVRSSAVHVTPGLLASADCSHRSSSAGNSASFSLTTRSADAIATSNSFNRSMSAFRGALMNGA